MQKFTMKCAVVLVCSATALAWAGGKHKQKANDDNENEGNRTIVSQVFNQLFNKRSFELVNQIYEPNCVVHHRNKTMTLSEALTDLREWQSAAPDMTMTIEKIRGEGDHLTVHWIARGTNTGTGHGLKPSGKPIVVRGHTEFKITNGKIAEEWNDFNEEEIFKQAGQTPPKG